VRSIHLDEISGDRWKPIRSTLGIRAFGVNAVVGDEGNQLIPEHDETEAGAGSQRHEELYLVLRGRATFVCSEQTLDAPSGTLVFVEDPAERRAATAEEDGTVVLAVGGPVGEPYRVAPWEYWFRVRAARAQGREDDAEAILAEGLAAYPDDATLRRLSTRS
jgi:hypothetical protein